MIARKEPTKHSFLFPFARLLLSALALVQFDFARAAEFEVNGVMIYQRDGKPEFPYDMRISVRDCKWSIVQRSMLGTNKMQRIQTELTYDGTNIYNLSHVERQVENEAWQVVSNSYAASLYSGEFPFRNLDPEIVLLFYAYASTCYLDTVTNNQTGPIKFQPRDLEMGNATVYSELDREVLPPMLPKRISFFLGPTRGWTNANLVSGDFTNVGGLTIPATVSLEHYYLGDRIGFLQNAFSEPPRCLPNA
jgi:hypothetical protein